MQDRAQPGKLLWPEGRAMSEVAPRPARRTLLLATTAGALLALSGSASILAGRFAPHARRLRQQASPATAPSRTLEEAQYRWMWGDAGKHALGHSFAELDPFRWSAWMGANPVVADMHRYNTGQNTGRPIEIEVAGVGGAVVKKFPHADQAIHYILQREHVAASPDKTEQPAYFKWMWADAGKNVFGHDVAEMDPFRWSMWMRPDGMIKDLEAFRTQANAGRKVEIVARSPGAPKLQFDSIDDAIRFLGHHKAPATPSAPEATTALTRPESSPSHSNTGASGSQSMGGDDGESSSMHHLLIGMGAFVTMAACAGVCFCCARHHSTKGNWDAIDDDGNGFCGDTCLGGEDSYANTAQALRGASAEGEFKSLLADAAAEALPPCDAPEESPTGTATPREAEQEVERILALRDPGALFGSGTAAQQKAEYRRLIRLLHPDKGLVTGQRASLALRRVVEANNAYNEAAAATE